MSNLFSRFLNNLIPVQCLLCARLIADRHSRHLCAACLAQLSDWPAQDSCPQCARPGTRGLRCGSCQRKPPAYDQSHARFLYVEPVKSLIHAAKFAQQWHIFPTLTQLLLTQIDQIDADLIVPLPLHNKRLQERGFNQALEIARPVSQQWGIPLRTDLLYRVSDTEHQARLSANARWKNLRGAFDCQENCSGKTIIVVDDVMTSGASLQAAAKALKQAGARHVINLLIARTPPHNG
ncbi:ComF family protein [Chitinibacter sp. S2-10]|uniref:ComF family protein n=1 Tax=Chitinibacter sp. S2-10 TaxID=3373597 RepID=UPI00397766F2